MLARKKEELEDVKKGYSYFSTSSEETGKEMPLVWIFVDECHESLPRENKTPATDALVTLLREGRQPGISLILATQQPGEIHKDVLTQSDIVISFRLTAKADIEALNAMMQTYLTADILNYINMAKEKAQEKKLSPEDIYKIGISVVVLLGAFIFIEKTGLLSKVSVNSSSSFVSFFFFGRYSFQLSVISFSKKSIGLILPFITTFPAGSLVLTFCSVVTNKLVKAILVTYSPLPSPTDPSFTGLPPAEGFAQSI